MRNYTYDAYGTPYILIGGTYVKLKAYLSNPLFSQSTRGNDRLYTGREYDGETGLCYYRAREYSPELGRFLQRDPIGQMDQVNLYTYVGNSPMGGVDPSGEWGEYPKATMDYLKDNADMVRIVRTPLYFPDQDLPGILKLHTEVIFYKNNHV